MTNLIRRIAETGFLVLACGWAVTASAGSLDLSWDANTEPALAGYRLYYATISFRAQNNAWYSVAEVKANPLFHSVDVATPLLTTTVGSLTTGITYYFRLTAYDNTAQESTFNLDAGDLDTQVTGVPSGAVDTTAPVLSAITASGITTTGANIAWTTNEAATTQIEYGLTTSYGNSTTLSSTLVMSHSQSLSGLTAGTLYHYRVKSKDASNNLATSSDKTFTTAADTTAPAFSSIVSIGITTSAATINWTTSEAATTQVEYGLTTSYGSATTLVSALVTSHSQSLSGLTAGTVYHYRVKSKDAANNLATSSDKTFTTNAVPDTTAPVITGIASAGITTSAGTIVWTTNEAATTQVEYGLTTSYGSATTLVSALATSHSQALSGLTSGTLYHYRVKSKDASNNLATSTDRTFTTLTVADTTPPVISAISSKGLTLSSATITWTTDEISSTEIEYGISIAYGATLNDSALVSSHSLELTDLLAGTVYHYRVNSRDASGNLVTSEDRTFITPDTTDTTDSTADPVSLHGNLFDPTRDEPMTIHVVSAVEGPVRSRIFTLGGTLVRDLGELSVWDGKDDAGVVVRNGAYFCEVRYPGGTKVKKAAVRKR
jgi:hypothetical protein